jgi:hypothetical protein
MAFSWRFPPQKDQGERIRAGGSESRRKEEEGEGRRIVNLEG